MTRFPRLAAPNCLTCGCVAATHRHHNHGTYCGRDHDEPCNRYRPRRKRWWQIWRPA